MYDVDSGDATSRAGLMNHRRDGKRADVVTDGGFFGEHR